jgi:hypothetical protein
MCSLLLKEVVSHYNDNNTPVYCCLVDASKAFDRVRLDKMFKLLLDKGLPAPILNVLLDTYERQCIQTTWNNCYSDPFTVTNGIKQGSVASPVFFAIYVDVLLEQLREKGMGCHIGHEFVGAVSYADDLTLLAPTVAALQDMLRTCEGFAAEYDVQYNSKKTICIKFDRKTSQPNIRITLNGEMIKWSDRVTHLGNMLTSRLNDIDDIDRKSNDFIIKINGLLVNFRSVPRSVMNHLFRSQCHFYGLQAWRLSNEKAIEVFHVKWRKSIIYKETMVSSVDHKVSTTTVNC